MSGEPELRTGGYALAHAIWSVSTGDSLHACLTHVVAAGGCASSSGAVFASPDRPSSMSQSGYPLPRLLSGPVRRSTRLAVVSGGPSKKAATYSRGKVGKRRARTDSNPLHFLSWGAGTP